MFELDQNKVTYKKGYFWGHCIVSIIMVIIGFRIVIMMLPFDEGYTLWDVFGLIFVCLWIIIVISMGIYAFVTNNKKLEINSEGVLCSTILKKKFLKWSEIADWGLSYCGKTRFEGNTYYLYFSEKPQKIKNECRKKLRGKMIKMYVIGNDYVEAVRDVIPFCTEKTSVEPFIGKDKFHLI